MVIELIALAQAAIPTAQPLVHLIYDVRCEIYASDGARHRIQGQIEDLDRYHRSAVIESASAAFPVDSGAIRIPNLGVGEIRLQILRGRTQYNYHFSVGPEPHFSNGFVTVSTREGMGPIRFAGTGLCEVATARADSQ